MPAIHYGRWVYGNNFYEYTESISVCPLFLQMTGNTINKACYRRLCWSVGMSTSCVITDAYGNKGINTFQSLRNKTRLISKQCFNRTAHTEGYNFAMEQLIAVSIAPIDAQLNAHSNGTNNSICANCAIRSVFSNWVTYVLWTHILAPWTLASADSRCQVANVHTHN